MNQTSNTNQKPTAYESIQTVIQNIEKALPNGWRICGGPLQGLWWAHQRQDKAPTSDRDIVLFRKTSVDGAVLCEIDATDWLDAVSKGITPDPQEVIQRVQRAIEGIKPLADPNATHTTVLSYKARGGELKELRIVQPLAPGQVRLTYDDISLLGRKIAEVLREDAG